jgi:hypothetical protein
MKQREEKDLRLGPAGCRRSEFRFKFRLRKVGRAEKIHTFIVNTLLQTSVWRWKEKALFVSTVQTEHDKPINIQATIITIIIGITVQGFK